MGFSEIQHENDIKKTKNLCPGKGTNLRSSKIIIEHSKSCDTSTLAHSCFTRIEKKIGAYLRGKKWPGSYGTGVPS
jgi:hypothetical protein